MKRIKKKTVWVKRIHIDAQTYDFIKSEQEQFYHIVENTAALNTGTKFVKPTVFEVFVLEIEQFFKQKRYEMIFAIIIILLTIFLERIINSITG